MGKGVLIIPEGNDLTKEDVLAHMKANGHDIEGVIIITANEAIAQGIDVDEIIAKQEVRSYMDKNITRVMQSIDRDMKPFIEPPQSKFFDSKPYSNSRKRKFKR